MRFGLLSVVTIALLLTLAACVPEETDLDARPPTGTDADGGGDEVETADGDDTLTYFQSQGIESLEITGLQPRGYPDGYEAAFAIFDGLVRFDENMEIEPALATDWSVSDNGLEWTFTLREDVEFHDGTLFDADAAEAHFATMLDSDINEGAYTLWAPIDEIESDGGHTLTLRTQEPFGGLLNVLAHGSGLIPSPAAVEEHGVEDIGLHPVGTGAYEVESFEPGTELTLTANENHFDGPPGFEQVVFRHVPDASSRVSALQTGEADVINDVPVENIGQLDEIDTASVIARPGLQIFGIALHQNHPALQDAQVRAALNHAVDGSQIQDTLFANTGEVLDSPLAPDIASHTEIGKFDYDPDRALQLLAEAGWNEGSDGLVERDGQTLSLRMLTPEGAYPNDVLVAESVQAQLREVGVDIELQTVESAVFWDELKVSRDASADAYDMVLWGYNPSHGDPHVQLHALFETNPDDDAPPPQWNHIWYSNDQVDAALGLARTAVDEGERARQLAAAQELVWEDAPYVWLYTNTVTVGHRTDVTGVEVLPVEFALIHRAQPAR